MTARASFWLGVALLLLAALSWSTAGLFPRLVSTDMFTTLFWRSLLGGLTVLALRLLLDRRPVPGGVWRLSPAEWALAVITAFAMLTFVAAFYFTTVADVVFIYGAFPIITLVLSAWLLHTGIQRVDVVCALGVALMVLPFARFSHTSGQDLAWLWLYGFLNIGVGFGLFLLGVQRVKAVLASLICMVEIPLAPLWAYALFGEVVTRQSLIGGAVILGAVLANLGWTAGFRQRDPSA